MSLHTACDLNSRSLGLLRHKQCSMDSFKLCSTRPRISLARRYAVVYARKNQGSQAGAAQVQRSGTVQALLSIAFAAAVGLGVVATPQPAQADSSLEGRQATLQRRKDLLAKTRERALQLGGTEAAPDAGGAAAAEEEQKVQADTAEAERSNQEREREAEKMRARLKSSLQTYEDSTKKGESMKPRSETPSGPNWFKSFTDNNSKDKEATADKPAPEPAPSAAPSKPAFSFSIPTPELEPAPTPLPSKPAFSFSDPTPEVPPPKSEYSQPEPKSPVPAPAPEIPAPTPETPKLPELPKPFFRFETPAKPAKPDIPETVPLPAPTPDTKNTPSLASSSEQKPWWERAAPKTEPAPEPAAPPSLFSAPKPADDQGANKVVEDAKKAVSAKQEQKKPEPKIETSKKPEPKIETSKKRKGPLPMFLSQLLVLASFGGLGYVSIKKEEETRKALAVAAKATTAAYNKVEGLVGKKK